MRPAATGAPRSPERRSSSWAPSRNPRLAVAQGNKTARIVIEKVLAPRAYNRRIDEDVEQEPPAFEERPSAEEVAATTAVAA
jgi:hypothetical protein